MSEEVVSKLHHAGEVTIEPCLAVIRDRTKDVHTRNTASGVLERVAKELPTTRERLADSVVQFIMSVPPEEETNDDRTANAFLLGVLEESRMERYIPFVERMFESHRIDRMITDKAWVIDSIQGKDPMAGRRQDLENFEMPEGNIMLQLAARMAAMKDPNAYAEDETPSPDELKPIIAPKRPGRNDPCWCGSGKKYKKCHLREDQERDRQKT